MPLVGLPVPEVSSWTASLRACSSDPICRSGFLSRVARMLGPRSVMTQSRAMSLRWGIRRTWQWAPVSLIPCSAALFTISVGSTWDGPGDGSSPFDEHNNRSLLNIVDDAVNAGALWVNAAGNHGAATWFKYDPHFTSGASRLLDFSGAGTIGGSGTTCNSVYLDDGKDYSFQLRWWDFSPGAVTDLDLLLYPASGFVSNPLGMSDGVDGGTDIQSGSDGSGAEDPHYAREVLEVKLGNLTSGYYCLAVKLNSGSDSRSVTEPPSERMVGQAGSNNSRMVQSWMAMRHLWLAVVAAAEPIGESSS